MNTNLAEVVTEDSQIAAAVTETNSKALAVRVTDQVSLGKAGDIAKGLREMKKQVTDWFSPMKKAAHESWKGICAKENDTLKPLEEAENYVRKQMNDYLAEQEKIRQEAERKARIAAEEAARKEREKLEAQAMKALDKGKDDKAEALMEQAEDVYAAPVHVEATAVAVKTENAHVGMQDKLIIEVTDIKAFLRALLDQNSAMTMIEVSPSKLTAWAKANAVDKFPGLRVEKTKVTVIR